VGPPGRAAPPRSSSSANVVNSLSRVFKRLAPVFVLALAIFGCGGGSSSEEGGTVTLKVGILPITNVAPLYLGEKKGFFRKEKLHVEPQVSEGGAATIPAVMSGDQQLAYSTTVSLVTAASKGLPVRMVAQAARGAKTPKTSFAGVMVGPDSKVRSADQLAGKTIAVNGLNNVNQVTTNASLKKRGVDFKSIKYIEVPLENMADALSSGRVDAAAAVEPFVTLGKKAGQRSLFDNYLEAGPGLAIGQYFTSDKYAQENKDVVDRFRRAIDKSMEYAQSHPDEARKIVLTYTKIKPAIAQEMKLPTWTTGVTRGDVEAAIAMTKDSGFIKKDPDVDALLPQGAGG
jgi:NitT/TauT family transport system substrate-binding protein